MLWTSGDCGVQLHIDLKIPLISIDSAAEVEPCLKKRIKKKQKQKKREMHLVPKLKRTLVLLGVNWINGMREESVSTCTVYVVGWWKCDFENLRGRPGCYISRKISTWAEGGQKRFAKDSYLRPFVCSSAVIAPPAFLTSVHFRWWKEKKRSRLYINISAFSSFSTIQQYRSLLLIPGQLD